MKSLRIVLTGGGSGGHVTPLLAVSEELERLARENKLLLEIFYCGPRDAFSIAFEERHIKTSYVINAKLRRYFSVVNIIDIPKIIAAFFVALGKLFLIMPDVVFSKGGTGALPIVVAAWFYRIPIIIHESDTVPGLTNLLSSRLAARVATSFEVAGKFFDPSITAQVGIPIRPSLLSESISKEAAKEQLGFVPEEPLVLIEGGSQGSKTINDLVVVSLANVLKIAGILHQTGRANFAEVESLTRAALLDLSVEVERKHPYRAVGYFDEATTRLALSAADVVVSRSGATSIYELAAFGKPSILIPLASAANDHQRANAYEYAKTGAAVVIEEENLLEPILLHELSMILSSPVQIKKMAEAALKFYKPSAARMIAEEVLRLGFGM